MSLSVGEIMFVSLLEGYFCAKGEEGRLSF